MFDTADQVAVALVDALTRPAARSADLLDRLATITALEGVLAAAKARTLVELHRSAPGVSADLGHEQPAVGDRDAEPGERLWCRELRSLSDEVGLTVGVGRATATRWVREASALVERCPSVWARLAQGALSPWAARAITAELAGVHDDDARARAEQAVLGWVDRYGTVRVRRAARREAVRADAELASLAHEVQSDDRSVRVQWLPYGMAELTVFAPAVDVAEAMTELSRRALTALRSGAERTVDQLRADLALDGLSSGVHESGDRRVGVVIHCTAAEAAGLLDRPAAKADADDADEDWQPRPYGLPTGGELAGYGTLPHGILAQAWRTATVRYRLTDASPAADPAVHDPSTALEQHVRDRDRGCRFPGCPASAEACDLDHRVPFPTDRPPPTTS